MQSELLCSQGDGLVWESHEHKKKKNFRGWWREVVASLYAWCFEQNVSVPQRGTFSKAFSSNVRVFGDGTFAR